MTPKELLNTIFITKQVGFNEKVTKLNSNIDQIEGKFLSGIIKQENYKKTIEIGCAYGLSSLFICDALSNSKSPSHCIVDPFQNTQWKGIGIENLKKCNIDFYKLIEKPSELALPELLASGAKFDFAFIDGWHTFDHTLIDFFYLNRMLEEGGTIVIDDVGLPAVRKLLRYVLNYPAYEFAGSVKLELSAKKKIYTNFILPPLKLVSKILPKKLKDDIFNDSFLQTDKSLGLQSSMVALRKIEEDNREWHWYKPF